MTDKIEAIEGIDALRVEAAALEAEATQATPEATPDPDAPPPVDLGAELAGLMQVAVTVLSPVFPSLKGIYTPEAIGAASGAIAAVCNKHGWLAGGMMGEYTEEITCAVVCLPLAVATWHGVKSDIATREAEKPKAVVGSADLTARPAEDAPVVGAATVTAGTVL